MTFAVAPKVVAFPRVGAIEGAAKPFKPQGPGLVLMGGKVDVQAAFKWMQETLVGGKGIKGGDLVVLTAASDNFRDAEISASANFDSVRTIRIEPGASAAEKADAAKLIREADAVFMGGGDQAKYLRWGPAIHSAIQGVFDDGGVVGGTSAGLAVLGEHVFGAQQGGVGPKEAVADPAMSKLELTPGFLKLPQLEGTVTDTHFAERNRLGRMIALMARQLESGSPIVRAIGVDEGVAVVVDKNGVGRVLKQGDAEGGAHLAQMGNGDLEPLTPGKALTANVRVRHVLTADEPFQLWSAPTTWGRVAVVDGKLPAGAVARYGFEVDGFDD